MQPVPAKDREDLRWIASTIRYIENNTRGVRLTAPAIVGHGCDLPERRVLHLCRTYTRALSALLSSDIGWDCDAYRYSASETFTTGAGAFGRLGGTHRGKSKYSAAYVFCSTSKPRTYPLPSLPSADMADAILSGE